MTREEAEAKYVDMFGGLPTFLLMGAEDDEVVDMLTECIEAGHELEAPDPDADY